MFLQNVYTCHTNLYKYTLLTHVARILYTSTRCLFMQTLGASFFFSRRLFAYTPPWLSHRANLPCRQSFGQIPTAWLTRAYQSRSTWTGAMRCLAMHPDICRFWIYMFALPVCRYTYILHTCVECFCLAIWYALVRVSSAELRHERHRKHLHRRETQRKPCTYAHVYWNIRTRTFRTWSAGRTLSYILILAYTYRSVYVCTCI